MSGVILFAGNLLIFTSVLDSFTDDVWIRSSGVTTVILILLSLGHLVEIRKILALPTLIILFGIINLKALHFLSIPF